MEYAIVLCSVLALMYGDINAMKITEKNSNENKIPLTGIREEKDNFKVDVGFLRLREEAKKNKWFNFVVKQSLGKLVGFFVKNSFDIDVKNENGKTALIIACEKGAATFIRYLLAYGADPNLSADNGTTPLSISVEKKNPKIVKMLMRTGIVKSNVYEEVLAEKYLREAVGVVEDAENALNSLEIAKKAAEAEGENRDMEDINNSIAKNQKILTEKLREKDDWSAIIELFEKNHAEAFKPSMIELSM